MNPLDLSIPTELLMTDKHWLVTKRQTIHNYQTKGKPFDKLLSQWQAHLQSSVERYQLRVNQIPKLTYPDDLPVVAKKEVILEAIQQHQVVIVAGETGSGKTTQLPKICLEAGRGIAGRIGHTQPRRLAARTVAYRIAEELQVPFGQGVGCQVRFQDQTQETTLVKLMTDGILLNEMQHDRLLYQYDTLIIDEAHERTLNIDFILGYVKTLLVKRPELKVIITSATIDVDRFAQHFDGAPVIEVTGRTYPVDTIYLPADKLGVEQEGDMAEMIVAAMKEVVALERDGLGYQQGDVLIFLPGEREIREASIALRRSQIPHIDILPLYARLSQQEQQKIFSSSRLRRVVLATNVAETSITVPGIRYVIDTGVARISRYSYRSKVQRLPVEKISQASANQRKGRCGRVAPGICLRLYSEDDFALRPEFMDAEILRTNLAQVILQMLNLRLGDISLFPFIDPPDNRFISDGFKLLQEIEAVDGKRQLTPLGKQIHQLPVDPKLAKMIHVAQGLGCSREVMIIVSGLSIQDPRERPADKQQQATQAHAQFQHKTSDFLTLLTLWDYFETQRQALSQNQLRKVLKKSFLSYLKLREWRDIHHQLHQAMTQAGMRINQAPASADAIHQAILSGLLGQIGQREEAKQYLGARGRHYHLFPGSGLYKKPPAWVMSAELVETSKLYARINAKIEPHWAIPYASHLIKYHYSEPAWSAKTGHVMAQRRTSLYGLTLVAKERVIYSKIDATICHELFIRQCLVNGGYAEYHKKPASFWQHNQAMIEDVLSLEAKSRRCDILVDEHKMYDFYSQRVPETINNVAAFDQWRKTAEKTKPQLLYFDQSTVMLHDAEQITQAQFPDKLILNQNPFQINYHFEPGHIEDGVSMVVPVYLLNQIENGHIAWLVPGLVAEKTTELLKKLPKAIRKQIVPIPDFVRDILKDVTPYEQDYYQVIQQALHQKGIMVEATTLKSLALDDYYRMNIQAINDENQVIAQGRDIDWLKQTCQQHINLAMTQQQPVIDEEIRYQSWDFDAIEQSLQIEKSGLTMTAYPAIVDLGDCVTTRLFDTQDKAQTAHRFGLLRLLCLTLTKDISYLKKQLFQGNEARLAIAALDLGEDFKLSLIEQVVMQTFLNETLPRDEHAFKACIDAHQGRLVTVMNHYEQLILSVSRLQKQIRKALKENHQLARLDALSDIKQQLNRLLQPGFIATPWKRLKCYPRYLKAILHRLEKLAHNPKEADNRREIQLLEQRLAEQLGDDFGQLNEKPQYTQYRWLLEEYRVSLFAQQLGTSETVSAKKLKQSWPKSIN